MPRRRTRTRQTVARCHRTGSKLPNIGFQGPHPVRERQETASSGSSTFPHLRPLHGFSQSRRFRFTVHALNLHPKPKPLLDLTCLQQKEELGNHRTHSTAIPYLTALCLCLCHSGGDRNEALWGSNNNNNNNATPAFERGVNL